MGSGVENSDTADVDSFARTFAPDRKRPVPRRLSHPWLLGGIAFVSAAILVLVVAWFGHQRALPSTGLLAMKPAPGLSIMQRRELNHDAAPWMALASLPLLASGLWLLWRRPNDRDTRAVGIVGAVLFTVGLIVMGAIVDGPVGIGY